MLDRDVHYNAKIKGEYLTHFADLLRIFTENILKHADDKAIQIDSKISVVCTANTALEITIENTITNTQSLETLKNVWKDEVIDIAKLFSEGKSGYHKAFKILKSDLKCERNSLKTFLNEGEDQFGVIMFIDLKELAA